MAKAAKRFKKKLAAQPRKEKQSEDIVFQLKSWQRKLLDLFKKGDLK